LPPADVAAAAAVAIGDDERRRLSPDKRNRNGDDGCDLTGASNTPVSATAVNIRASKRKLMVSAQQVKQNSFKTVLKRF